MRKGLLIGLLGMAHLAAWAQPSAVLLLKQDRDGAPAQNLTAAEFTSLGDPFFNLVLKNRADALKLSDVETLLQPSASERQTFVVDESIADPRRGQARRVVLAFSGSNGSEVLTTNVMLSLSFSSESFPDNPRMIEAWGWDNHRGRYNYYKLDQTGTPDMRLSWKFRGSSNDADLLSSADRAGTCMSCHVNGAPVMKELLLPWNNWHSFSSRAAYLTPAAPVASRWPVGADQHLQRLAGAEDLETSILSAITQFNLRRINRALAREDATGNVAIGADGRATVKEGRRLLRSLFATTEYNIISARQKSGLHALSGAKPTGPGQSVALPASFFLNAALLGQRSPAGFLGIGISRGADFAAFALSAQEYQSLIEASGVRLGGAQGDADFAWLSPEPSHIDNDMVDRLIRMGAVTPQFVAAALSVDLEAPVFSSDRETLLAFVPDEFAFVPTPQGANPLSGARHPDNLTTKTIAALKAAAPARGSPASQFLALLQATDPLKLLSDRIEAYHARVSSALGNPLTKRAEIDRLFGILVERRRKALNHEVLGELNETGDRLFPVR